MSNEQLLPRAIVWDWDDTLANGWPAITAALNASPAAFALPLWTEAETRARARHSIRDSFPPIFGPEWPRAAEIFAESYRLGHLESVRAMPGAGDVLQALSGRVKMSVVSNKQGDFVRAEAERLDFAQYFHAVIGAGDAEADKPHPAPFHMALAPTGVTPGPGIWYIGDTGLDMRAARAWGCTAVLLGDAAHDGGLAALQSARSAPDLQFIDVPALLLYLARLA
jgi:phosphoglycolate phosphatase